MTINKDSRQARVIIASLFFVTILSIQPIYATMLVVPEPTLMVKIFPFIFGPLLKAWMLVRFKEKDVVFKKGLFLAVYIVEIVWVIIASQILGNFLTVIYSYVLLMPYFNMILLTGGSRMHVKYLFSLRYFFKALLLALSLPAVVLIFVLIFMIGWFSGCSLIYHH